MPPPSAALAESKTVFVANIPYDVTEEQLATIFSEVGPVAGFDLKFDQNTGRAKGFGFCHYYDHETALSAVRNLQEVPVSGRTLRVELSTDEPLQRRDGRPVGRQGVKGTPAGIPPPGMSVPPRFVEDRGPGGPGMGGPGGGFGPPGIGGPASGPGPRVDLSALPPGQDVAPGVKATDVISKTLASIPPGKLEEVLMQMKALVQASPEQARTVLGAHPQLAYALFQAMLLMNVVDPSILNRMQPLHNPAAAPPMPAYGAPPSSYPAGPGGPGGYGAPGPGGPPPPGPGYGTPPNRSYGAPPPQPQGYNAPPPAPYAQGPPGGGGYGRPGPPAGQGYGPGPGAGAGGYGAGPAGYVGTPPQQQQGPPAHMQPPPQGVKPNHAVLGTLPEEQRNMILQVLALSNDQVNVLPPDQKASVMQLRQQFSLP